MERGCSPRRSRDCLHEPTESAWMEQDEGKESVVRLHIKKRLQLLLSSCLCQSLLGEVTLFVSWDK